MAKLFNGMISFASAIKPTGAQPLDDRTVVQSMTDLLAEETFGLAKYNGMLVAVIDEEQVYMLIDKDNATSEESWVAVGSGNGSIAVETYAEAVELATSDNIGQVIYVKTKSSYDADGEEGEGEAVEYEAAPYIVIGEGSLMKLAASTASGSIEGDVAELRTKVGNLETTVGGEESGLVKEVADLKAEVEGIVIPEVPVQDVQVGGVSVLDENGVANIVFPDLTVYETVENADKVRERVTDVEEGLKTKVEQVEGQRLMTDAEGVKLGGIAEGAQVNVIEKIKVNDSEIAISNADKSVNITIPSAPVQGVAEGEKIISLDGDKLKSTLTIAYVSATDSEDGKAQLRLQGIGNEVISSINADDFVKDGMVESVVLDGPASGETGKKYLVITWNTDSGKDITRLDVSELFNPYTASNGISLTDGNFSLKLATGEQYLSVGTDGLATTQALWNKVTELDNAVLESGKTYAESVAQTAEDNAKAYADGLNDAMNTRVETLEKFDHSVYALKNDVYAKTEADNTFVKKEGFNEFTTDMESKLEGIAEGAQVNVIESVSVNGVDVTITDKKAEITFEADDIKLGTAITAGEDENGEPKVVYGTGSTITDVLQGIQDSVTVAVSGGLTGVVAGDGMAVSAVSANKQTVSAKISTDEGNLLKVSETDKGLFVAMYYDGDDAE
jgi:hypothetical protein